MRFENVQKHTLDLQSYNLLPRDVANEIHLNKQSRIENVENMRNACAPPHFDVRDDNVLLANETHSSDGKELETMVPDPICIMTPYVERYPLKNQTSPSSTKRHAEPYTPLLITPELSRYKTASDSSIQSKVDDLLLGLREDANMSPIMSDRFGFNSLETSSVVGMNDLLLSSLNEPPLVNNITDVSDSSIQHLSTTWSPLFDTPSRPSFMQEADGLPNSPFHRAACDKALRDAKFTQPLTETFALQIPQDHNEKNDDYNCKYDSNKIKLYSKPQQGAQGIEDLCTSPSLDFKTARGKSVRVDETTLERAKQRHLEKNASFDDTTMIIESQQSYEKTNSSTEIPIKTGVESTMGFMSARGRSIDIAQEKLKWAREFLEVESDERLELSKKSRCENSFSEVKKSSIEEMENEAKIIPSTSGFQSAKGKMIAVDASKMKWAEDFFSEKPLQLEDGSNKPHITVTSLTKPLDSIDNAISIPSLKVSSIIDYRTNRVQLCEGPRNSIHNSARKNSLSMPKVSPQLNSSTPQMDSNKRRIFRTPFKSPSIVSRLSMRTPIKSEDKVKKCPSKVANESSPEPHHSRIRKPYNLSKLTLKPFSTYVDTLLLKDS
jgi:hypothetical protein